MHKLLDTLSSIGLAYDIVGVSVLAWAIFWARDRELRLQASPQWDINDNVYRALLVQRRDVRFGLIVTAMGFVFQWLGQAYSGSLSHWQAASLWALLIVATTIFLWFRERGVGSKVQQALAEFERESNATSSKGENK